MMRIGSGTLSGRKLHAPKGSRTRPTSARLKKSVFDVLASRLDGARVLDLYAGAGALGLEALSRGAARAVFVDRSRRAVDAIRRNLDELDLQDRSELRPVAVRAALGALTDEEESFDIVFADPPYADAALQGLLTTLGGGSVLTEHAIVVVEHHHKQELGERYGSLERFRQLKAGESCFTLYRSIC